ncbi:MAG: succinate--CoA ligase subunit alpha, partial [Planctomycetota bacterium]
MSEALAKRGFTFVEILALFQADPATKGIVLVGEIGGSAEEEAAEFIRRNVKKPVAAFIAGRSAPSGRRMGHAGAIVEAGAGGAEAKIEALKSAGVRVTDNPAKIGETMRDAMAGR